MPEPTRTANAGDWVAARYQIEELMGRGGMGTVYRVRDQRSGKLRALKRVWASDRRRARKRETLLEREYHTLAQLAHPRIIEVYEYGLDEHGPYYTMELLDGADIDASGRLPWKQVCELLYDVASSLAILHARGLIHRDVSSRNVRRTPEGRAKLIDFGAMAAMGVAVEVIGTPPFVAPEVLQMQELDGRSDLYSLGALGYYMLTGRNAYPARSLRELRDVWRSRPVPPARLVSDVPAGLSALILQLLMLDRSARPSRAAEVMERLRGLADLPRDESLEVPLAYLTTPSLVGRDAALVCARRQILSLVRRDGSTLLIEGVAGSGRSRMLSACALEAKILGAVVLRAGAGAVDDWAVARALCGQLCELMPSEAADAARLTRDVLGHVIETFGNDATLSALPPERSLLLRTLRDFVLTLSRSQRLVLVVDDLDKVDEPSAAFLAALAHKTERHGLMLALAVDTEQEGAVSGALRLVRLVAQTIQLPALQPEQTLTLMSSVFGDVPNLQLIAAKIHGLAQGNPRATMDLAHHLRERGLARYEAGSWLLPAQLDEGDLPKTLADALAGQLAALSADARALLELQCLAEGDELTLSDYTELTPFGEHGRVFAAVAELVAARVLLVDAEHCRLRQRGYLGVLQERVPVERRRAIHAALAAFLGKVGGDVPRRADHLLRADKAREAIELLASIDLQAQLPSVSLLERAIEQAECLRCPALTIHRLRIALLSKASVVLSADSFRRVLPGVLTRLEQDSGLALYRELAQLPEPERLQQALAQTHERYARTPEAERVHSVSEAIRELARLSGAVCSFAMQLFELEALESLPSLTPLMPLSAGLEVIAAVVEACKQWIAGRPLLHRQLSEQVLARISVPDLGGLDPLQHARTELGLHYAVALFEASCGITSVERRLELLDAAREYRVTAWRLRMLLHITQGNAEEARKCERRAEVLQLQERSEQRYVGMGSASEIMALAETADLLGVKNCVAQLTVLARSYPGWRPYLAYGECRYRWLQGDLQGALEALSSGLALARPTRHNAFVSLAGAHVRLLAELGRADEAVLRGREYLELFVRERLLSLDRGVHVGLAQALASTGEHREAARIIEDAIAVGEKMGSAGLALGLLYETRARIAAGAGDRAAFEHFSQRCANEYAKARNPALSARFARILDDARQHDIAGSQATPDVQALLELPYSETGLNSVHSRILECIDESDRARCALTLLLQSADSASGCLYGVRDGRAELLAALPDTLAAERLSEWAQDCLEREVGSRAPAAPARSEEVVRSGGSLRAADSEGRLLEPVFLFASQSRPMRIAALLALQLPAGGHPPPRQLLEELADELILHGDVTGLELEEISTRES